MEGRNKIGSAGRGEVNAAGKLVVVTVLDMNREARLELGDARNLPAVQHLAL